MREPEPFDVSFSGDVSRFPLESMSTDRTAEQLSALAAFLAGRHKAILQAWKAVVDADPALEAASTISLTHFRNRIPEILEDFERRLRGEKTIRFAREEEKRLGEHALHRWKHGYSLREVVVEWGHLQICVQRALEAYALAHPLLEPRVMPLAREAWTQHCNEAMAETAAEYSQLQRPKPPGTSTTSSRPWRVCSNWNASAPRPGTRPRTTCAATSAW